MTRKRFKNVATFVGILAFIVGWIVLLYVYSPATVVEWMGVGNSYLVSFLLGIFGALASMTPVSTYPGVYTITAGGANPFIVVAATAVGLTIGDLLFFLFGASARGAASEKIREKIERLTTWLSEKPTYVIQITVFVWVGILPLANNLLIAPLAFAGFAIRKLSIPLFLGNITFPAMTAYLAYQGLEYIL